MWHIAPVFTTALALKICGKENVSDPQVKWEYLKFEIRKFKIQYSKKLAKSLQLERMKLGTKLKELKKNTISDFSDNQEYMS